MRITDIKEARVSIASDIANAYISFARMDVSILAIYTDAKVDGRQVVADGRVLTLDHDAACARLEKGGRCQFLGFKNRG